MEVVDGFYPEPIGRSLKETINTTGLNEEDAIKVVIGSTQFTSTKGKQVKGNEKGKSAFMKTRKYRQVLKQKSNYNVPLTRQDLEAAKSVNKSS